MAKKAKPKKMPKLLIASSESGDWEQLYLDGKRGYGNHSINWRDVLDALGIEWDTAEVSEEWLENNHCAFPELAKDLPKEAADEPPSQDVEGVCQDCGKHYRTTWPGGTCPACNGRIIPEQEGSK